MDSPLKTIIINIILSWKYNPFVYKIIIVEMQFSMAKMLTRQFLLTKVGLCFSPSYKVIALFLSLLCAWDYNIRIDLYQGRYTPYEYTMR